MVGEHGASGVVTGVSVAVVWSCVELEDANVNLGAVGRVEVEVSVARVTVDEVLDEDQVTILAQAQADAEVVNVVGGVMDDVDVLVKTDDVGGMKDGT